MAILVTGGAGFIGSHTVVELLEAGYDVVIADNLYNSKEIVIDRIEKIAGRRPKFYKQDICDRAGLEKIFDEEKIGVEMDNGTTVNIRWSEIEFIKAFKATVAIFASDKSRALIIPVKHWDPIAKFMEDNRIIVKFYR